ncbi:response regulator [Euryarchaeota archaeon ex4484_178]|nr:MAG: response regulator [Euryarchaeota archaeon ex4484_178]
MGGSIKMLVIDDNKELTKIIEKYMEKKGFDVLVANTVQEAMKIIEKGERIDVMLLDLMLPDIHGLEFLKIIREHEKNVAIIVITGLKDLNTVIEVMKAGADDYLVKPFRLGELEEKVHEILYKKAMSEPIREELTAERAMEVIDSTPYHGGMFKFSFADIEELNKFVEEVNSREDVAIRDVKIGENYEVYVTKRRRNGTD